MYKDPTGEYALIDDLIVMGVGGLINLGVNALQGNVNSWGEGFGYFVSGAAAAEVTIYAGPIAGGAVLGAGNNLTAQVSANGWSNINTSQLIFSSFMGGATAYVGGAITNNISPYVSSWMSNITGSPVIQQAVTQGISNATSGFIIGTGVSKLNGNDWNTALRDGGKGALFGGGLGLTTGIISGYSYSIKNHVNPWNGKTLYPPNDGFELGSEYNTQANKGDQLIHYGDNERSRYLTTPGTKPEQLSLPPSNNLQLNKYNVEYPFNLRGGIAAPWFNQPGGGTQYMSPVPIWWLLEKGYISPAP